jgi:hypothetical protein
MNKTTNTVPDSGDSRQIHWPELVWNTTAYKSDSFEKSSVFRRNTTGNEKPHSIFAQGNTENLRNLYTVSEIGENTGLFRRLTTSSFTFPPETVGKSHQIRRHPSWILHMSSTIFPSFPTRYGKTTVFPTLPAKSTDFLTTSSKILRLAWKRDNLQNMSQPQSQGKNSTIVIFHCHPPSKQNEQLFIPPHSTMRIWNIFLPTILLLTKRHTTLVTFPKLNKAHSALMKTLKLTRNRS